MTFLHQPDGALANDLALREQLVREIRTFRPDAVLATDPETIFYDDGGINHTDHRAAGMAAVDAVYPAARNPMAFPWLARGGLAAHRVRRLYLFWSNRPRRLGRRLGDARAQDRRAARARQPDPRPRRPRRPDPRVGGRGGRSRSASPPPRRCGSSSSTTTRTKGRAESRSTRPVRRSSSSSGRTRPQSFQSSARPSARRPSIATSSPRRQVAGGRRRGTRRRRRSRRGTASAISASVGQCRIRIGSSPA